MDSIDREDLLADVAALVEKLKDANEMLDVATPQILPEVGKFLRHCQPMAELLYTHFTGPRFQAAVKVKEVLRLTNTLVGTGMNPNEALDEAKRIVEAAYIELKVF